MDMKKVIVKLGNEYRGDWMAPVRPGTYAMPSLNETDIRKKAKKTPGNYAYHTKDDFYP